MKIGFSSLQVEIQFLSMIVTLVSTIVMSYTRSFQRAAVPDYYIKRLTKMLVKSEKSWKRLIYCNRTVKRYTLVNNQLPCIKYQVMISAEIISLHIANWNWMWILRCNYFVPWHSHLFIGKFLFAYLFKLSRLNYYMRLTVLNSILCIGKDIQEWNVHVLMKP